MLYLKKKKTSIFLAIILAIALSTSAYAYVNYKLLNVPAKKQEKTNWCWAACTQMVCYYFGTYPTQSDIVTYIYGSPVDVDGTITDIKNALSHWGISSTTSRYAQSFSFIVGQIDKNQPMIVGRAHHAEVIRGYYEDTSTSKQDVYYINPADGSYNIMPYLTFRGSWDGGTVYNIYVN